MTSNELLNFWLSATDKELALFELGSEKTIELIEFLLDDRRIN